MTLLAEGTALPDVTRQRASIFLKKVSPTSGFIIQADNRRDPRLQPSCSTKLYTVHEPIWEQRVPAACRAGLCLKEASSFVFGTELLLFLCTSLESP